ncbi:DoxX family protein [Ramlibacter sp.]|jgi:putative oxidoreductase|uniref:DoxX family protein n=1 Tax=Ramlibacter sp. TaxID=1917967 RepID=UPI002FC79CF9|nr:DoxX family protein [Ramlibacter sp.]MCE3271831.1 DoxX family protein [Ramlibacter sp.]
MATVASPYASTNDYALTPAQNAFALLGRVLIAALFIPSGWGKIAGFSGLVGYIASKGVPLPEVCAAIAIAVELGLGILLLVGFKTRWVGLLMAIFVLVITPIFHAYWAVDAAQVMAQKQSFYKNIAIAGGLLAYAAFGAGAFSVDGSRRRT